MAVGDTLWFGPSSVANNAFLDLQPSGTVEVSVNNIAHAGSCELYAYDGTNDAGPASLVGTGVETNLALHCTNAKRYRVKNVSGGSIIISAEGITTHV